MAQLRDIRTSECVFEGTPEECVFVAEKLGRDEVLFDDVGLNFDPDAVLTAHADNLTSFEALSKSRAEGVTAADRAAAKERAQTLREQHAEAAQQQEAVEAAIADARARLEG